MYYISVHRWSWPLSLLIVIVIILTNSKTYFKMQYSIYGTSLYYTLRVTRGLRSACYCNCNHFRHPVSSNVVYYAGPLYADPRLTRGLIELARKYDNNTLIIQEYT